MKHHLVVHPIYHNTILTSADQRWNPKERDREKRRVPARQRRHQRWRRWRRLSCVASRRDIAHPVAPSLSLSLKSTSFAFSSIFERGIGRKERALKKGRRNTKVGPTEEPRCIERTRSCENIEKTLTFQFYERGIGTLEDMHWATDSVGPIERSRCIERPRPCDCISRDIGLSWPINSYFYFWLG